MDRMQLLLVGLPLFLFVSDVVNIFTPSPPAPSKPSHNLHHQHYSPVVAPTIKQNLDFPPKDLRSVLQNDIGFGNVINLQFCSSCSYRGTAVTMARMLETSFPGVRVVLENYPPPFPKRLLSKMVPVIQFGVIVIVTAGEHIFPRLGIITPSWYFSLRANKFGTIASTWVVGNVMQSFLQSSGAFEVYCNGDLVFSKMNESRFPSEFELRDIVGKKLGGESKLL